ncbi:MAG: glycosyltransferase [Acidimicrobiia bacterium]
MRLAMFSVHSSPLAQPGAGDAGGVTVYVHALASALARAGIECDVIVRADASDLPPVVTVEPGFRVVHLAAGPPVELDKHGNAELIDEMFEAFMALDDVHEYDVLHANYWISGAVAHRAKHALDVPLMSTFHTLDRVKAEVGIDDDPVTRAQVEREVIACSDLMLASTAEEVLQLVELYDADPTRIEVVPPGVDHDAFNPGPPGAAVAARMLLGLAGKRVLLFAGRIQPLKGAALAVETLAALDRPDTVLAIVGGPSGPDGEAELARVHREVETAGLHERVHFFDPQPHRRLGMFFRAADLCLVPSRAESFGLVALEAAACGTPVVASAVGGLRTVVAPGRSGLLVESRDPHAWADACRAVLDDPAYARRLSEHALLRSRDFAWSVTAARLRRLTADLVAREPLRCR